MAGRIDGKEWMVIVDLDCGFWDCDWDGQERRLLSVLGVGV